MMTNPHDWLHWRKRCHSSFQMIRNQFFLSLFCFSLCFFLTFFSPKAIWTVEVCICYKLENTAVNVCVLKPASASFMNPIIQNLPHKWLTYGDVSKHYLSWHQAGTLEKPVLKKHPYSLGIFITTKRKRPNQETWLHAL